MDNLSSRQGCYTISNDDAISHPTNTMMSTLPRRGAIYTPIPDGTPRKDSVLMTMAPGGTLPRSVGGNYGPSNSKTLQSLATIAKRYLNVSQRHTSNFPVNERQMEYLRAIERNDIEEVREILRLFDPQEHSIVFQGTESDVFDEGSTSHNQRDRPTLDVTGDLPSEVETDLVEIRDGKNKKNSKSSGLPKFRNVTSKYMSSNLDAEKGQGLDKPPQIREVKPSPKFPNPNQSEKKKRTAFNKNCKDQFGRTGLFIAISRRNLEMTELLLSHHVDVGECLYHAIDFGYYDIVERLLAFDELRDQVISGEDSFYPPGLTPIQLAAHKNDFLMLKLLHNNGFRIMGERLKERQKKRVFSKKIRSGSAHAESYHNILLEKAWDQSNDRVLYYRALASPAYLIMMYTEGGFDDEPQDSDFLEKVFRLYEKLKKKANREPDARSLYLHLAEQVEGFACDLLNEVRSAEDLSDFLRFDPPGHQRATLPRNHLLPVQTACEVHMKNFVAHQHCQLTLSILRMGTLFDTDRAWKTLLFRTFLAVMFPILSLAFIIAPNSRFGSLLRNPMVNFSCHMVSDIAFLLLMVTRLFTMWDRKCDCLGTPPTVIEYVILTWVLARTVNELKKLREVRLLSLLSNIWKLNDFATLGMFYIVIALRISDLVRFNWKYEGPDTCLINRGNRLCDRSQWRVDEYGPLLVSEGCMSFIYILIFVRAMEMSYIDRTFGPLQLSLDKMLLDVLKFGISFFIFTFFAFACGMTQLYWAYGTPRMNRRNVTDAKVCTEETQQEGNCYPVYSSIPDSLLEQFWTIFGYGYTTEPPQSLDTPDENIKLTYYIGLILSGLFHCWAVIVMLNMLIAMMSHSFDRVRDNAEVEWKFHRTNTWMKYIRKGVYPRPPPMNVIPSPRDVSSIYQKIKAMIMRCRGESHYASRRAAHRADITQDNGVESMRYRQAINKVTNRYLRKHLLEEFQHDEDGLLLQQQPSKSNSPRKLSTVKC